MPQDGAIARSGRGLQGCPNGRRVIVERGEATLLSPNESAQDGRGAEAINRPASAAVRQSAPWDTLERDYHACIGHPGGRRSHAKSRAVAKLNVPVGGAASRCSLICPLGKHRGNGW